MLYRPPTRPPPTAFRWRRVVLFVPLAAVLGVLLNFWFGVSDYDTSYAGLLALSANSSSNLQQQQQQQLVMNNPSNVTASTPSAASSSSSKQGNLETAAARLGQDWCEQVNKARSNLMSSLHIQVPCETMKPAKSAIVCMLTDGVSDDKATRVVFTATNYIHGAMALGASLMDRIDHTQTHMLLLLRQGFELAHDDLIRLQSVGWIIGTAPNVPLSPKFLPRFPRYKTTYTKISAIGLAEYDCVMLMDADTLAVGDLQDIMKCNIFTQPQHRVGGTLDLYRGHWHLFNTGSILWRTSSQEMERVFNLTVDPTFMKAFSSDQDFLNHVYPERLNNTANHLILTGEMSQVSDTAQVVDMTWNYNAQTHVEVERPQWWEDHRPGVRILHFTEKKGWQCEERHDPPPPMSEMPQCQKEIPICYCREAHLYWEALNTAHSLANKILLPGSAANDKEDGTTR